MSNFTATKAALVLAIGLVHPLWAQSNKSNLAPQSSASQDSANQSPEVLFKRGYSEIIYDPEYIPTLGLKMGIKTLILLPSDERIIRVEPGVRGTAIEIKYGANWVAVRPNIAKLETNCHIATDQGRVYTFNMVEGGGPHKEPHQKVVVVRPDMELEADGTPVVETAPRQGAPVQGVSLQAPPQQERPVAAVVGMDDEGGTPVQVQKVAGVPGAEVLQRLDDDYRIKNEKEKIFKVSRVYNDGRRTFVVFKTAMLEAPLFYRVDPQGKREILTYRMDSGKDTRDPDLFIIPRLVDKGVVKIGDYESTFSWKKAE